MVLVSPRRSEGRWGAGGRTDGLSFHDEAMTGSLGLPWGYKLAGWDKAPVKGGLTDLLWPVPSIGDAWMTEPSQAVPV